MAAKAVVPLLVSYVQDGDSDIHAQAAEALGTLHAEADVAVPALVKLLGDEEPWPRFAAAWALGE